MKFSVQVPGMNLYPPGVDHWWKDVTTDQIVAYAQRADELGFDYTTIPWHIGLNERMAEELGPRWVHALSAAGFVLGATRRLKVVCLMVVPCHDPVELAKSIATLDYMSGGRFVPMIMSGYQRWEFELLRRPFDERQAVTDEALDAMRVLWETPGPASFHGQHVAFDDVIFDPKPVQKPLPLWIGGSAKPALRRIARHGDGWLTPGLPRAAIPGALEYVRAQPEFQARPRRLEVLLPMFEGLRDPITHELLKPAPISTDLDVIIEQLEEIAGLGATLTNATELVGGGLFQDQPGAIPPPRDLAEQIERLEWFAETVLPPARAIGAG